MRLSAIGFSAGYLHHDTDPRAVTDIVDKVTRSRMMSGIRGKDTKPEMVLRRALHARGLRYRVHVKEIQGRPDIVFPRFRAVVFVQGCFWHRHKNCRFATTPATRTHFWQAKFAANVERDRVVREALLSLGWRMAIVWECALRRSHQPETAAEKVHDWLMTDKKVLEIVEQHP